jgi:hypothetical protein
VHSLSIYPSSKIFSIVPENSSQEMSLRNAFFADFINQKKLDES